MENAKLISKALLIAAIGMSLGGKQLDAMGRRERGQYQQQQAPRRQPVRRVQPAPVPRRQPVRRVQPAPAPRRRPVRRVQPAPAPRRRPVRPGNANIVALQNAATQLTANIRNRRGVYTDARSAAAQNIVFIQLPGLGQRGATCGIHAMINAELLATNNDLEAARAAINSQQTGQRIRANYYRGENVSNALLARWQAEAIPGVDIAFSAIVPGTNVYRTITGFQLANSRLRYYRNHNYREVFVFNTGGHWIAVRLQRIARNGRMAVILVDTNSQNRINGYRNRLVQLVRSVRGF